MRKNLFITGTVGIIALAIYFLETATSSGTGKANTVYEKLSNGRNIHYLVIGDSIGRGSGAEAIEDRWYSQLEVLLKDKMGVQAKRQSIVQSGATAFEGIYRFQTSSRLRPPDVIFIFFGENDRKYMDAHEFSYFYDKLLRDAKTRFPDAEIITITESPLKQDDFARQIQRISYHYGAKNIDMRKVFRETGMLTEKLTADTVHPNGTGYQLYANEIFNILLKNSKNKPNIAQLKNSLYANSEFTLKTVGRAKKMEGFINEEDFYTSSTPGDYIQFHFDGPMLGVKLTRKENGGMVKVYIDGKYIRTISTWWPFPRERNLYVASGLEEGKHTVKFEVINQKSSHNSSDQGNIQISSILCAEKKKRLNNPL
ncbi:SGNH/GDSL hydrolase family protein [Bacillus massilinigeriensis]|uniref:SGNH/GDSL hydrolase family protein n=1 Tax=Bacillus mediterraneensis TaxID=1805474 RepID=UPI0008F8A3B2|nr:SGNH/GDSL hydrolase family protein [Bacillus mediterraneensis]